MKIKRGSTSVRRLIFIADTSSTTGAGLANLVHNSSGLVAYYFAGDLNNEVQITLVTATLGTFASGGFVAVDNTNMPGWYEIGIPDAAMDGGNEVAIQLRGATNMAPVNIYIQLDAVDYQDATAFGISRIDAAVSSRMATYTQPAGFLAATFPTTVASPTNITAATGVVLSGVTHTGAVIPTVSTVTNGVTASTVSDKTGYSLTAGTGLGNQTANITGNLSGSVGSVTGGVTVSTNNDKTGYTLSQAFPTNFASMSIDANGKVLLQPTQTGVTIPTVTSVTNGVTASTVSDKTGYSLTQAFPTNFSSLAIAAGTGAVTVKGDAFGNTLVLTNLANASQIPAEFTSATFASTGVFSTAALANAPAGGGGGSTDWTANERTAIRSILGFDSNGTVSLPTVGVMDAIKDKTDLITSDGISVLEDRVNESTITMQYNESTTASVNLDEDTTSATLQFVVSRPDGTDILTIANGSITRTASSFTVTITTAVTATLGQYLWSLRDITGGTNRVVTKGVLTVQNAASA